MSFSFSNSDNVGNQSSKYNWWLLQQLLQEGKNQPFCTIVLWLITDFSSIHEKIIYHSWLSNLHHIFRSIFFGLYCHTPLLPLAFAGIIYSSTHCTSSYLTFKQFCHASSSNGLILNNLFCFWDLFCIFGSVASYVKKMHTKKLTKLWSIAWFSNLHFKGKHWLNLKKIGFF